MASTRRVKKKSVKKPARKVAPKKPAKKSAKKTAPKSQRAQKSAATRGATLKVKETKKLVETSRRRYGTNAKTTQRLKEQLRNARRWELEAKNATSLSAKKRARANAGKALDAARNTFKAATREATHGQARSGGWKEVRRFDARQTERNTFTQYEHARRGAGSVLSMLESRPGVVGVLSWRRVSQVENRNPSGLTARGTLRPELAERARDVKRDLKMTTNQQEEFDTLLVEAELYGVELELEVENYVEA